LGLDVFAASREDLHEVRLKHLFYVCVTCNVFGICAVQVCWLVHGYAPICESVSIKLEKVLYIYSVADCG